MNTVQKLKQDPDAAHLFSLWGAVEEYLLRYKRDTQDLVLLRCLTLLVAMKNNHDAFAERLIDDEPDFDISPRSVLYQKLWVASSELAPKIRKRREILSLDISSDNINLRLFSWVTEQRHETLARLLLEAFDINVGEEIVVWLSLEVAADSGHVTAFAFHLSELGMNDTALARWGPQLVEKAVKREDLSVMGMLLKVGTVLVDSWLLSNASYDGRDAIVNCLLQSVIDVNENDLLKRATERGHETTIDLLMQGGARLFPCCVSTAMNSDHESIAIKFLQASAVSYPNDLLSAVFKGSERIVVMIQQSDTNLDQSGAMQSAIGGENEWLID